KTNVEASIVKRLMNVVSMARTAMPMLGNITSQIIQVYIGTSATNLENQTTYPTLPVSLPAGQIVRLTIDYPWEPSKTYYFKIIPSAGQQPLGPFPEQAPSS
ncbi:MAG: hypothetical protein QXM86_00930, partial [Candidatus Bathyarchaeia archaeon]